MGPMNQYTVFVELVPHAVISNWGQFILVFCALGVAQSRSALLDEDKIGRGDLWTIS